MDEYLFTSWAKFGEIHGLKKIRTRRLYVCFLLLNNEKLIFKSEQMRPIQEISIRDISTLVKEKTGSDHYLKIITAAKQQFAVCVAYASSKKPDNYNTDQLYSLLLSLEGVKSKKEQQIIEKLKSMIHVSPRISIPMLKEVLAVETSTFYQNIYKLAAQLNLTIDGDSLKVDQISVSDFIKGLNEYFKLGISDEVLNEDKLSCPYCGSPLKENDKFCTQCGTSLVKDNDDE